MEKWKTVRAADFIEFNPRLSIKKGSIATKIAMDKLQPFTKKIVVTEQAAFTGGSKFCNGDTIMARITPCLENGKTSYVDILADGEVAFGSTEFIVLRAKAGVSDPQYIYYLATSPMFRTIAIKSMVGSSGRQRVQQGVLEELELTVPALENQRKIGVFLSSLDQKIALNNEINDNLQRQLLALYSELLVAHDIQQTVDLKTLCAFQEGYVNPSQTHPEYFDGNVKWLRAVDINESFIIETSRTLTTAGFESAKKSALLFQPNTIAISKSGTIGRLGIIADYMCGNRAVINIRPHNPSHLPLIYAFLKSRQKEFPDLAVGSVQKNLYVSILESLQLVLPETTAVDAFCNTGCAILELIRNNCQENVSLTNLRDSLLPKLMTGKIDVSSIDT